MQEQANPETKRIAMTKLEAAKNNLHMQFAQGEIFGGLLQFRNETGRNVTMAELEQWCEDGWK